jgi:hypothetical protein
LELIIFVLDDLKNNFGEFDEVMFKDVERLFGLIFCIPDIEKSDLVDVAYV